MVALVNREHQGNVTGVKVVDDVKRLKTRVEEIAGENSFLKEKLELADQELRKACALKDSALQRVRESS